MRKGIAILLMVSSATSYAGKKGSKHRATPEDTGVSKEELIADEHRAQLPSVYDLTGHVVQAVLNQDPTPKSTIILMDHLHTILLGKFRTLMLQKPSPRKLNAFFRTQYLIHERIFGHESRFGGIAFENYKNYDKNAQMVDGKDPDPVINAFWRWAHSDSEYINEDLMNAMNPYINICRKNIHVDPAIASAINETLAEASRNQWAFLDFKRLSYGLWELAAFYRLVTYSFDALFEDQYFKASLQNTLENDPQNPVLNPDTWASFKMNHYNNKSDHKKVFLDPWVKVFDKYFSGDYLRDLEIQYLPNNFNFENFQISEQSLNYLPLDVSIESEQVWNQPIVGNPYQTVVYMSHPHYNYLTY